MADPPIGKAESKALRRVLSKFTESGIDPMKLADQLYSKEIIDASLHNRVTGQVKGQDDSHSLRELIQDVKKSVEYSPDVFNDFLAVLDDKHGPAGKGIALELRAHRRAEFKMNQTFDETNISAILDNCVTTNHPFESQKAECMIPSANSGYVDHPLTLRNKRSSSQSIDSNDTLPNEKIIRLDVECASSESFEPQDTECVGSSPLTANTISGYVAVKTATDHPLTLCNKRSSSQSIDSNDKLPNEKIIRLDVECNEQINDCHLAKNPTQSVVSCPSTHSSGSVPVVSKKPTSSVGDIILRLPNGAGSARKYQLELAKPGLNGENYIICAPTGSGKTLVSAIIIRNHLIEKRKAGMRGVVIFVVKTQQLAFQQRKTLEDYLEGASVVEIAGESESPVCSTLPQVDIVVCTSGKLHRELLCRDIKLSSATLLILDECHHATKEDLYAAIMEHYLIEKHLLNTPQVIGMTASPGAGRGKTPSLFQAISHQKKLCARMDATSGIKCVEAEKHELSKYICEPNHIVSALQQRDHAANSFIQTMLQAMHALEEMLPIKSLSMFNRGSLAYQQWVNSEIESAQIGGIDEQRDQIGILELLGLYALALMTYNDFELKHAMQILKEFSSTEDCLNSTVIEKKLKQRHIELENKLAASCGGSASTSNPLLLKCAELLEKHFLTKPNSKGLFFVRDVKHTLFVADWIQSHPTLSKFLKPSSICGHSKKGMTKEEQISVIEGFRRGDFNILVSTSVLEEGLDVPECNLVVRFQILSNDIADVQAEGRARAEESTMHTIVISNSNMHYNQLINADKKDLALKAVSCLSKTGVEQSFMREQQSVILSQREQRLLAEKIREAQWNTKDVKLLCRKCGTVACNATDVSKYGTNPASPTYIVPSEAFAREKMKKMKRKNKPEPVTVSEFSRPYKIHCIECNEEWGIWGCWKGGEQYPVLKCTSFTFLNERLQRRENCRQWKKVPFKVFFYSDYKGVEED